MNLVKIYRHLANLSQIELSEKTGIDQSVLSKIERNQIPISCDKKTLISKALNVDLKILFPYDKGETNINE
jgi:transcriptional regulator with XRE-family HTH domain